jgi:Uma2 family endonuclease
MSLRSTQTEPSPPASQGRGRRSEPMPSKIVCNDLDEIRTLIRRRRRSGLDRFDEVWDGVYVMSPQPNPEHMLLSGMLTYVFLSALDPSRVLGVAPGGNVSDRREDWAKNYRCPDVLVFLAGNQAEQLESHWFGGPDFAVEIISRGDRARKKLGFYAKVGVRELLLIDRKPWRLELYRLNEGSFAPVGISDLQQAAPITSSLLNLTFRLIADKPRPKIEITCPADGRSWLA